DVGPTSNVIRNQEIYKNDFKSLKENISSYSFTDSQTKEAILDLYNKYNYVADPHGAVGYLGCISYLKEHPSAHCVFLETAHPTKFLDVVEDVIKEKQPLPEQIQSVMGKEKVAERISTYEDLKAFLLK